MLAWHVGVMPVRDRAREAAEWLRTFVCRHFHGRPMHPFEGVYRCKVCLRTYPTGWDGPMPARPDAPDYARDLPFLRKEVAATRVR